MRQILAGHLIAGKLHNRGQQGICDATTAKGTHREILNEQGPLERRPSRIVSFFFQMMGDLAYLIR